MIRSIMFTTLTLMASDCLAAAANPEASSDPITIRLQVTGDEALKQPLEACIAAELKKDPLVHVGDTRDALTFDVIATKQKMSDGSVLGYLMYLGGYLPAAQSPDHPDPSPGVLIQWQTLRMAPPDLTAACHRAVSDYKAEVVQPVRRSLERFRQSLQPKGHD